MKTFYILIICLFINILSYSQGSIYGHVRYANTDSTLIDDSTVVTVYQGSVIVNQMPVNPDGSFYFDGLADGNYKVKAVVSKKAGGWNAMDSYQIVLFFVGYPTLLSGIYFKAADVNGSGGIPASTDALTILRRFVGQIPAYMPPYTVPPGMPDWVSENITVNILSGSAEVITVKVLCTGDVNGSFTPY